MNNEYFQNQQPVGSSGSIDLNPDQTSGNDLATPDNTPDQISENTENHNPAASGQPVIDHQLDDLQWDGIPRLDEWLIRSFGANDTPYVRAVGALILQGLCRRARKPGIKFDYMLILEGAQGLGKSQSARILTGDDDWFSDAGVFAAKTDRDRGELLQGNWIVECAELDGLRKNDVEDMKRFLTVTQDEYRAAYARVPKKRPRRCIFIGTTNNSKWNRDSTGARRFLPIKCEKVDLEWLRANRDQLIAEADRFRGPLVLPQHVIEEAKAEQKARREEHPWDDILTEMNPDCIFAGLERIRAKTVREDVLKLSAADLKNGHVGKIIIERMNHLGYDGPKTTNFGNDVKERGYTRPILGDGIAGDWPYHPRLLDGSGIQCPDVDDKIPI